MFWAFACDGANHAPLLQPFPPQTVVVGDQLVIPIYGTDLDGDPLSYSLVDAPDGMTLHSTTSPPEIHWAPLANDTKPGGQQYTIQVTAVDGRGGKATETVFVTVLLPGGVPVFTSSAGNVANLAEKPYVAFAISVKDDDSATVSLTMHNPIEGSIFQQNGPKSGLFYWKPTPKQVASSLIWTFSMVADDGIFAPVAQHITIVLFQSGSDPCPGTPPSVVHTHPKEPAPGQPVPILVGTTESESTVHQVVVWWWLDDNGVNMETAAPDGVDSWFALLVPPAIAPGKTSVLRYFIEATDNDDLVFEHCDHTTRYPKAGHVAILLRGPAPTSCPNDLWEPNNTPETAAQLPFGTTNELRTCNDEDWYILTLPANTILVSTLYPMMNTGELPSFSFVGDDKSELVSWPGGPTYPRLTYGPIATDSTVFVRVTPNGAPESFYSLEIDVDYVDCAPDSFEPNDQLNTATAFPDATSQPLSLCPGDVDLFAVALAAGSTIEAEIGFDHTLGDIDAWLVSPDGGYLTASTSATSDERIVFRAETATTVVLEVAASGVVHNNYYLSVVIYDDASVCYDDLLSPNTTSDDAVTLPIGSWSGLRLCPFGSDWFAHDLNGGEQLSAYVVNSDGSIPNIRFWFGDPPALVAESVLSQGGALCSTVTPDAGRIYIEVYGVTAVPTETEYQIDIVVVDAAGACWNDRFEPNNNALDAWRTPPTLLTHGTLCEDDSDWFEVDVPIFATFSAWIVTADPNASVRIELRSPNGDVTAQSTTVDGFGMTETVVFQSGLWHVRVVDPDQSNQAYDLWVDVKN